MEKTNLTSINSISCGTCAFSDRVLNDNDIIPICRFKPGVIVGGWAFDPRTGPQLLQAVVWPRVDMTRDWCGEHQAKD